jgi:hypothetical protein
LLGLTLLIGISFTFIYCFRIILICRQTYRSPLSNIHWRRKEIRSSRGLLGLNCCLAWILIENLWTGLPPFSLLERTVLLFLLSLSFFTWIFLPKANSLFVITFYGSEIGFKQLNNFLLNQRSWDRNYLDRFNWKLLRGSMWIFLTKNKNFKRRIYFLIFFLFCWSLIL